MTEEAMPQKFEAGPRPASKTELEPLGSLLVSEWAVKILGGEVVKKNLPKERGKTGSETFEMFFARGGGGLLPKDAKEPGEGYEWVVNSHTWDVMNGAVEIAEWLREERQEVDMKVLVTAAILHDVGKGFYLRATRGVNWNRVYTDNRPGLKEKLDTIGHAGFTVLLLNAATKDNPDADPEFVEKVKEVILAHDQVVPTQYDKAGQMIRPVAPVSLEAMILLEADHATGEFDKETGSWQTTESRLTAIESRWVTRDHVITADEFEKYERLVKENHDHLFKDLLGGKHQVSDIPLTPGTLVQQVIKQVESTLGVEIPPAKHWL